MLCRIGKGNQRSAIIITIRAPGQSQDDLVRRLSINFSFLREMFPSPGRGGIVAKLSAACHCRYFSELRSAMTWSSLGLVDLVGRPAQRVSRVALRQKNRAVRWGNLKALSSHYLRAFVVDG